LIEEIQEKTFGERNAYLGCVWFGCLVGLRKRNEEIKWKVKVMEHDGEENGAANKRKKETRK
jgi:hypothetical protein